MKKRILSLFLCLVMVLALVPASVSAAGTYDVWVNGEQFTDSKLTIQCGTGTATYNPAKAELTLENATITATYDGSGRAACIYSDPKITIVTKGTNVIQAKDQKRETGIYADSGVAISGDGTLKIETYSTCIDCPYDVTISTDSFVKLAPATGYAIFASNLTLCGSGDLIIDSVSTGIYATGDLTISDEKFVQITSTDGYGILASGILTASGNGDVAIIARYGGLYGYRGIVFSDNRNLLFFGQQGLFSYGNVELSTSGDVTIIAGYTGISTNSDIMVSGSGDVTIAATQDGAYCHGNLVLSGSGDVSLYGSSNGIRFWGEEGKVLLNGIHSSIEISTDSGNKAVLNDETDESPVEGINLDQYIRQGNPAFESVTYTLRDPAYADCGGNMNICALAPFTDAPKHTNWAHAGIEFCVRRGLMTGTSATTFEPKTTMSRAMLVTVLYRMEGEPGAGSASFTDVKAGKWFSDAVSWAADCGIVNGVGGGAFNPNGSVTREQIATILFRYAEYKGYNTKLSNDLSGFADADTVGKWFVDGMKWAVAAGLINGSVKDGKTYLTPDGNATREQVAAILMRFVKNAEEEERGKDPLRIRLQPHNAVAPEGTKASFTVAVQGGTSPYIYRWQLRYKIAGKYTDWEDMNEPWAEGEQSQCLTVVVSSADFEFQYQFRCIVTDAAGTNVVTEPVGVLAESTTPVYTTVDPEDQYAQVGSTVILNVAVAGGMPPYKYQWQYTSDNLGGWVEVGTGWSTGSQTDTLSFKVTQSDITYHFRFRCVVTDALGNGVVSLPAYIRAYRPLEIKTHPKDMSVPVGSPIALSVEAQYGQPAYSYRWQVRWKDSSGSYSEWRAIAGNWAEGYTTNYLTFHVTQEDYDNWYQYRCQVTDNAGNVVYSRPSAMVPPGTGLMVKLQPESQEAGLGHWVEFHAEAMGGKAPYKFNWQFRSTEFDWVTMNDPSWHGKETDTLFILAQERDFKYNYEYRCMITDANGKKVYTDPVHVIKP